MYDRENVTKELNTLLHDYFRSIKDNLVTVDSVRKSVLDFLLETYEVLFKEYLDRLEKEFDESIGDSFNPYIVSQKVDLYVRLGSLLGEKTLLDIEVVNIPYIVERLAISEIHLVEERASVDSANIFETLTGLKLYKRWNSRLSKKTCRVCRALHGTRVAISDSFLSVVDESFPPETQDFLTYEGGYVSYAHPFCQCWLTYEVE